MSKIVGIGANVFDTLIQVPCFPLEDAKLAVSRITLCGGGPCATGLVAASRLGADCAFIGGFADDTGGRFLREDFKRYGVSTVYTETIKGRSSFASYILINEQNASRTCVFHKGDMPSLSLSRIQEEAVRTADILMVDGNEMDAALAAARLAGESGTAVVYDAGGLYDGVERLLPYADILIPSEEFALGHTGAKTAEQAAERLMCLYHPSVVVVTQGRDGGVYLTDGKSGRYPAFAVHAVDTNGAGDVFHGAFAFAAAEGCGLESCCIFASAVSAIKCTGFGARQSVPELDTVNKFLKERGYDEFEKKLDKEIW